MGVTTIEWTDRSVNPIRARAPGVLGERLGHYCEKVSPGCKHCYASQIQPRFGMPQFQAQRGGLRPELRLDDSKLAEVLSRRIPTKWFWCDMTDMFGDWVPDTWIAACFGVMAATPHHTHQVLTKRPDRMRKWFEWVAKCGELGKSLFPYDDDAWRIRQMLNVEALRAGCSSKLLQNHGGPWPLPNVWLGCSAEDQRRADERISELLCCPAAVRFVSAEPLLGPIDMFAFLSGQLRDKCLGILNQSDHRVPGIDWVIAGGESGPGARPCDVWWAVELLEQCKQAGVAFFMKQLGTHPLVPVSDPEASNYGERLPLKLRHPKGGDWNEWPRGLRQDLRVREFPR